MNQRIRLLKLIDRVLGKSLVYILSFLEFIGLSKKSKNSINSKSRLQRLLIIRPGGIGDAVLLLPSIGALKRDYPELEIDILCEKRNSGVFELSEDIEHVYLYDRGLGLFQCLRNRYDAVIDTEQWHRLSAVISYLCSAPVRIGFDTNERRRLFTHRIPYSHDDYEVYSFFNLLVPIIRRAPQFNHDKPFVEIKETDFAFRQYLSEKTIVIFPGASVKERRWGGERFGFVSKRLKERGYNVIIIGSGADSEDARKIMNISPDSIDLTGKTSLREVAYILRSSSLLITSDSGLLHLAVAVGTPTVSLFGSGIEKKWAPKGKRHRIINKQMPCSPCTRFGYTPECKKEMICMNAISVEDVLAAVDDLLKD